MIRNKRLKSTILTSPVKRLALDKIKGMDGRNRSNIRPGTEVAIVLKEDQRTGELTEGTVQNILTNSQFHPHGIKVRLTTGEVGRVKKILGS